ncbi:ion transporter [Sabulilitoribacter multivorans]|uniref:Ion transporter n=1 Tax=Flaviramulus multivorans TaxID=1304750 RepID=A0ABS9IHH3_9FLAO|nr:ion transporter [Flaviramulus multivorans]MCF7560209.1 ion transporter [Flaviramulus multivorans]
MSKKPRNKSLSGRISRIKKKSKIYFHIIIDLLFLKKRELRPWQIKLHEIIFGANTKSGKLFDVVLFYVIIASIILVMLESVRELDAKFHTLFKVLEWIITILFTIEYITRIITIKAPRKYIFSFYGIVDLLSTIPMYLSFIIVGSHSLVALRALRLLRVFRILKLARYMGESTNFVIALKESRAKIAVFLSFVVILCIILGTLMYLIEAPDAGFTSIPRSVYWAIVTLTTVGYGDIAPQTPIGQLIASAIMILGYGIIAIPTGIVSAEMAKTKKKDPPTSVKSCKNCLYDDHAHNAEFCSKCGSKLDDE